MVMGEATIETKVAVVGGGPGGYAAAVRAADLGLDVTLIDVEEQPGGVCLFRGCIPSKALLHASQLIDDACQADQIGVTFLEPEVDVGALRAWKDGVVDRLTSGLVTLCKKREVQVLHHVAQIWRFGSVIRSWLLDLTAKALAQGQALADVEGWVADSGEGRWPVLEAIEQDVPAPVITLASLRRLASRQEESYAFKLLATMRNQFGGHAVIESD